MSDMMEQMLRNPEMQKMLYPYLPEPMRNPQVCCCCCLPPASDHLL